MKLTRQQCVSKAGKASAESRRAIWDNRRAEIVRQYQAGAMLKTIAEKYGVGRQVIASHLKRWGEFDFDRVKPQQAKGVKVGGIKINPDIHLRNALLAELRAVAKCESLQSNHPEEKRWRVNRTAARKFARYQHNPFWRFMVAQRLRIWKWLKRPQGLKTRRTIQHLGCTHAQLIAHIEKQFKPGMTWDNYGSLWESDHIRPCVSFDLSDLAQAAACFHFTNLQPLTIRDNRVKQGQHDGRNHRRTSTNLQSQVDASFEAKRS